MTSPPPEKDLPKEVHQYLDYLRGLHLDAPKLGNIYLEDSALQEYTASTFATNKSFT